MNIRDVTKIALIFIGVISSGITLNPMPMLARATIPAHEDDKGHQAMQRRNLMSKVALHLGLVMLPLMALGQEDRLVALPNAARLQWQQVIKAETQLRPIFRKAREATVGLLDDATGGHATGVLISADGYILTAAHVVQRPATKFRVVLHCGDTYRATALGMSLDSGLDCGMLKIDAEALGGDELPFADLGWSSKLKANEVCLSFGHAGGVLPGRPAIARLGSIVTTATDDSGLLQSTCLMEPGDSGGPLFDSRGRVIGIHSGIGPNLDENFETPIDAFRFCWKQLISSKQFRITDVMAECFGVRLGADSLVSEVVGLLSGRKGAPVSEVVPESWADRQGFRKNDRVHQVNGIGIESDAQFQLLLLRHFLLRTDGLIINSVRSGKNIEIKVDFSSVQSQLHQNEKLSCGTGPRCHLSLPKRAFKSIEERLDDYSVTVTDLEPKPVKLAAGCLLKMQGRAFVVSKSSLVKDQSRIQGELAGRFASQVIHRDEATDLAVFEVSKEIDAIDLSKEPSVPDEFSLLLSPSESGRGADGILGAAPYDVMAAGILGVGLARKSNRVSIESVKPRGAASKAGLKPGDVVIAIDGEQVLTRQQLTKLVGRHKPGDKICVTVKRHKRRLELVAKLGISDEQTGSLLLLLHAATYFEGGKSKRCVGFANALVHDGAVQSQDCGGPVFTSKGRFVGINIARRSRTRSYVIPATQVRQFS